MDALYLEKKTKILLNKITKTVTIQVIWLSDTLQVLITWTDKNINLLFNNNNNSLAITHIRYNSEIRHANRSAAYFETVSSFVLHCNTM